MTVVPFVRRPDRAPHGLRVAVRRDLRTGLAAAGAVQGWSGDAAAALAAARALWRHPSPLAIAPPPETYADAASAGDFAAALAAANISPRTVDIEVEEAALAGRSLAGVERLRARGFGVALAIHPECPLPLSGRTRSLFTEIVLPAPPRLDPFLGVDPDDMRPVARRLFAAKASGLLATAVGVSDATWGRALAAAGFDRGEGF